MNAPSSHPVAVASRLSPNIRYEFASLSLGRGSEVLHAQLANWLSGARIAAESERLIETEGIADLHHRLTSLGVEVSQLLHSCCNGSCCDRTQSTNKLPAHIIAVLRHTGTDTSWNSWSLQLTSELSASDLKILEIEHVLNSDWRLTLYGYRLVWGLANNPRREG